MVAPPISAASPPTLDDPSTLRRVATFREVVDEFGGGLVAFILTMEFLVRGLLAAGITGLLLPFLKDELQITDSASYQRYQSVVLLAWAVAKPSMGLISDALPLFGYHKRYYLIAASVLGALFLSWASTVRIGANTGDKDAMALQFAVACFFVLSCVVSLDILVQSTYSAVVRDRDHVGSALLTYAYATQTLGGIISALVVGALADAGQIRVMLWILIPVCALTAIPPLFNWAAEPKVKDKTPDATALLTPSHSQPGYGGVDREDGTKSFPVLPVDARLGGDRVEFLHRRDFKVLSPYLNESLRDHPDLVVFTLLIIIFGLAVGVSMMLLPVAAALVLIWACLGVLQWLCFRWLNFIQAKALLGLVTCNALRFSITGALSYFYLASPECLPGGPHFEYKLFTSTVAVVGAVATGIGLAIFHRFLSHESYRWVVAASIAFGCLTTFGDLIVITRVNKTYLGIPDNVAFIVTNAMVDPAVTMITNMPLVLLMARLCPHGVESITFAILAGLANLAATAGNVGGQFLTKFVGIRSELPCDFTALPYLVVFVGLIVPMAFLPAVYWLLPAKTMDQPLMSRDALE